MTEQVKNNQVKKRKYFPTSFTVIIAIMILFIIASWIGYAVDPSRVKGIGILDVFTSIWHGFKGKAEVILFIFSIGGTLGVMTKIKAIDAGISALVNKLGDKVWLLIPSLMIVFGLGGTTYGMWEETIAFIPILIPVFKKAGYGPFVAILVILVGAGVGCLASTINPFATGAAVGAINDAPEIKAANIEMTTGTQQGLRWISWVIFEVIAIAVVSLMANRYRKANLAKLTTVAQVKESQTNKGFLSFFTSPKVVEGIDNKLIDSRFKETENVEFTTKRKISLGLFIFAFILMILMYLPWGAILGNSISKVQDNYSKSMFWFASTSSAGFAKIGEWYFISVGGMFLFITIIIFAIHFKDFKSNDENAEEGFISTYLVGVKDVVGVCLLIATAGGLGSILEATNLGTLIAQESAKGLTSWIAFGVVVFLVSIFLSLLVPSTSGFAGAFMPIFAGIAVTAFPAQKETALGISILGFIFANGLANFITPTSATLMGYTSYAGIPYNVWLKQTWKITLLFFFVALGLITIFSYAASTGSNLF